MKKVEFMKKLFFTATLLCCFVLGVFAQQPVVAVAPFDAISGISATDANMITRVFFIRLGNTNRVSLVDRGVVERVLQEHRFQAGDWSDSQKTAELGRALNADWIVRGELERFGNNILVTVQFYDIKTFRFMGGTDLRLANADEAYDRMDPLVNKLIETISGSAVRPPVTPAPAPQSAYQIGGFGPAGGFIFYDKGVFSNGWRYLEAAPAETEFTAEWGRLEEIYEGSGRNRRLVDYRGVVVSGTGTVVGSGKRNTELIVESLRSAGETGRAAQLCASLNFDGHRDWFLPSKDELDLMYKNLKQRGLGGFSNNNWYWSSSQYNDYHAWNQRFSDGLQNASLKNGTSTVRAIRAF
jgi:TolB-like protein